MTARDEEIIGAKEEGCELLELHAPKRIETDDKGRVSGLVVEKQIIGGLSRGLVGRRPPSIWLAHPCAAIASGLNNTRQLLEALMRGTVEHDFIEIMACPGGCAGGGGQPIHDGEELAGVRGDVLWTMDRDCDLRFSHENPSVKLIYDEFYGEPLSELSEELLHTDHFGWEMPLAPASAPNLQPRGYPFCSNGVLPFVQMGLPLM